MDNPYELSDEEIWGKEPTLEERQMEKEINELKMRVIDIEDKLDIADYCIEEISEIVKKAIGENIRKTNKEPTPYIVKCYRESLLVLRAIEKELKDYNERIAS